MEKMAPVGGFPTIPSEFPMTAHRHSGHLVPEVPPSAASSAPCEPSPWGCHTSRLLAPTPIMLSGVSGRRALLNPVCCHHCEQIFTPPPLRLCSASAVDPCRANFSLKAVRPTRQRLCPAACPAVDSVQWLLTLFAPIKAEFGGHSRVWRWADWVGSKFRRTSRLPASLHRAAVSSAVHATVCRVRTAVPLLPIAALLPDSMRTALDADPVHAPGAWQRAMSVSNNETDYHAAPVAAPHTVALILHKGHLGGRRSPTHRSSLHAS
ncbi:hypothetical protein K469DRAFT_695376 [Zopfia rhizophila CBS 207.26]|uniref:Uncharacterized protein n=1 Tax=Zopfia rhizophila CBS 207.26 TaxID=1314779 RepID=A0A6A6DGH4_9PEZI|nr:hypothetical protein K469DRAFT_695376 [Zopfia rhizophila CBS 207.26]